MTKLDINAKRAAGTEDEDDFFARWGADWTAKSNATSNAASNAEADEAVAKAVNALNAEVKLFADGITLETIASAIAAEIDFAKEKFGVEVAAAILRANAGRSAAEKDKLIEIVADALAIAVEEVLLVGAKERAKEMASSVLTLALAAAYTGAGAGPEPTSSDADDFTSTLDAAHF